MKCNNCEFENSPSFNFCENCGKKFPEHCKSCGSPPGFYKNYCENCGVSLEDSQIPAPLPHPTPHELEPKESEIEEPVLHRKSQEKIKDKRLTSTAPEQSIEIDLSGFLTTGDDRCYVKGRIPEIQLSAAIQTFAFDAKPEDVLVFADNTIRKNGKLGFLLTKEKLYCKGDFQAPLEIPLGSIKSISLKKGFINKNIIINGQEFLTLGLISTETGDCLVSSLKTSLSI